MNNSEFCLVVASPADIPGHSMYGDWALPDREYSYISLLDLVRELGPGRGPVEIDHARICAKPGDWYGGNDFAGPRFESADTRYPGLVVEDMPNPCKRPFRLIDGRRRLEKLNRRGISRSLFVNFTYSEVMPFIRDFRFDR